MPLNPTLLTAVSDGVDRINYPTVSISPTAERWLVADVWSRRVAPIATPIPSGLGLTWITELAVELTDDRVLARFYAWTGATPGSGALNFDCGTTQQACAWSVYVLGADVDVTDPFVQTLPTTNAASASSIAVALAAFASADNRPLIAHYHADNTLSTPKAGFTEISDTKIDVSPIHNLSVAYHASSPDEDPSISWTPATSPSMAIASEIRAASVAPPAAGLTLITT